MLIVAIIASLFSSAFNAGASVLERLSTKAPEIHTLISRKQAVKNALSKLFVFGFLLQILSFLSQAAALSQASLVVVEPLLTTDLIFLLLILHFKLKLRVGLKEWLAVAAMIIGMSGLFVAAHPQGGSVEFQAFPWIITTLSITSVILACLYIVKHVTSPKKRAAAGAIAASVSFSLIAAFTKLSLNQLHNGGFVYMLSDWPIYALILSGVLSIYLLQTAYGSGPLAIAQPILEVTEPTVSVLIGINVFGDTILHTPLRLLVELLCIGIVGWGIVILSTSSRVQRAEEKGV